MGMGSYGAYAETVEEAFVNSVCPKEFGEFSRALKDCGIDFDEFCRYLDEEVGLDSEFEEANSELFDAFEKLQLAFLLQTGLALETAYHIAEDRGDELDGGSFARDGVYKMTPDAKKIEEHIRRKWWTTFG